MATRRSELARPVDVSAIQLGGVAALVLGLTVTALLAVDAAYGVLFWVSLAITALAGAALGVSGLAARLALQERAVARERTELAAAAEHKLEQADRYADLLERDLVRVRRDIDSIAYAASHDLAEPLRGVRGFVGALRAHPEVDEREELRELVDLAMGEAERMGELLDDLLRYSRVGRGDRPYVAVDLAELVDGLSGQVLVGQRGNATISRTRMPVVLGDRLDLTELFSNLLSNAVKFGGPAPEVRVSARRVAGGWEFRVTDSGPGVADVHQEKIFEVFGRLHARSEFPGTGAGLAICRRAVESAGGWIRCESDIDGQTSFVAWLPERRKSGRAHMG